MLFQVASHSTLVPFFSLRTDGGHLQKKTSTMQRHQRHQREPRDQREQRDLDPLILSFTHLKELDRQDEALHYLKRIASLVKPLMRARRWRVPLLSEMYPDQHNLLGLNVGGGQRILLRLRQPFDRNQFLPFEKMVDTMLHELAHIVHGPHDEKFNALWDELRDELDRLMMKGYTGEAFLGTGQRVGGQGIPDHELARRLARAEAERHKPVLVPGGRRLGGAAPPNIRDAIRDAMLSSIERRNGAERGCASTHHTDREIQAISQTWVRNGFRTQAEEDAANEAAIAQALWELVQEDKRKYGNQNTLPSARAPGPFESFLQDRYRSQRPDAFRFPAERPPAVPTATRPAPRPRSPEARDYWACRICTLHNPTRSTECDACGGPRPPSNAR